MSKSSSWRYQPVFTVHDTGENEDSLEFSVCEVYLDKDGTLEMWTEDPKISPCGYTVDELLDDLELMIADVRKWKPVRYDSLRVGMCFDKTE